MPSPTALQPLHRSVAVPRASEKPVLESHLGFGCSWATTGANPFFVFNYAVVVSSIKWQGTCVNLIRRSCFTMLGAILVCCRESDLFDGSDHQSLCDRHYSFFVAISSRAIRSRT